MSEVAFVRKYATRLSVIVLAALAYIPALASSPRTMPADTKLYLYLDPGRLVTDAPWTYDGRQFAGWVPHQVISYLWPQGPWYWFWEALGVSDWIAHRLWIGSLLFAAGLGVRWAARRLGLGVTAALAAAVVYQLSPYILPYVSRTSALLLPWAALGWIVGCTVGAATRTKWRDAATVALIVATVGAPNPTALIMIVPAPVLYLLVAAAQRQVTWRRATSAALKIGVLSLGVSLWWITMVSIQRRHGADVLAYSESLDAVSFTSSSPEVWRGLGYWLFYVRDPYAATTTAAVDYMASGRVIASGFAIVLIGLVGLVLARWAHRRYAIALVVTGLILAVGVHPIADPSAIIDLLVGDGEQGVGLALRSSTRAVPVLLFGLALGAGALVDALGSWRPAVRPSVHTAIRLGAGAIVAALAVVNLPSLTGTRLVDPALDRDQDVPAAWTEAAAALDDGSRAYRVLQVPGAEFGAFRWGYTVDPPLPGLIDRSIVTRDLLPLGSPPAMDLLYAFDDRFQSGTIEPRSIAPVARLFGADTIWVANDMAFDRFRTPRPELTHDLFAAGVPGLGEPVPFGEPAVNEPDVPMVDEASVADSRVGDPLPPVELVPVEDPVPIIRTATDEVLLSGSGDGIVDAAGAGLIDGTELIRYSASLGTADLADAAASASRLIVTDSNRDRAHHWRSSQDVTGFTEPGGDGTAALAFDTGDERLPVFDRDDLDAQTVAEQRGPVTATASAYGEPFAYQPEHRPVMAIDGDPSTSWVVGDRAGAIGERIVLEIAEPVDTVRLRQPDGASGMRHVSEVRVDVDNVVVPQEPQVVTLDERSFTDPGQAITIDPTAGPATITVTITATATPDPTPGPALAAVGFAEIDVGLTPTREVVRSPVDATAALADAPDGPPTSFVLTRLRTRPSDRWRSDPEPAMVREIDIGSLTEFTPAVTVRLDQRATDAVLTDLLGIDGPVADRRLTGVAAAGGWAAADRDRQTAWITPFGGAVGSSLEMTIGRPVRRLRIIQPPGDFSVITELRVSDGTTTLDVDVPAPDASGVSTIVLDEPLDAGIASLEITGIESRLTVDRRWAEPVELPAAIAEIRPLRRAAIPETVDTGCRDDLVTVDGAPIAVRVRAPAADLLAGEAVEAEPCEGGGGLLALAAGSHIVDTSSSRGSGLQVDQIVLAEPSPAAGRPEAPDAASAEVIAQGRLDRTVSVDACPDGCWLILGDGYHEQWTANVDAGDHPGPLGEPQLVSGGFNGWLLDPSDQPATVDLRWTAQSALTRALIASAVAIVVAIVLAVADRRRRRARRTPVTMASWGTRDTKVSTIAAGVVWVIGTLLFVEPGWAPWAVLGAGVVYLTGRTRIAGLVAIGALAMIAVVTLRVVQDERLFADAGWPARFEWLHGLGMFAAVSLVACAFGRTRRLPPRPPPPALDADRTMTPAPLPPPAELEPPTSAAAVT